MELHTAGHRRGVVCAPHAAAVEAGRQMLAEGGNALEAMLAMAASIAAVYPHMNHIGGDGFWMIRERSGRVRAIMAAGPPAAQARPELYRDYETIPTRGPLAALTVPGAIGGWALALEAAKAFGRKIAARCPARAGHRAGPQRLHRHAQPGAADAGEFRQPERRAGLCRGVFGRRQVARRRRRA